MGRSKSDWFWKQQPKTIPLSTLNQARQEMADRDQSWADGQRSTPPASDNRVAETVNTVPETKFQDTTESLREQLKSAIIQGENTVARMERELELQRNYLTGNRGALQLLDQLPQQGAGVFVKVPA